jgi:hypothetical protein
VNESSATCPDYFGYHFRHGGRRALDRGPDFPATKLALIDAAADAGAPQELVERLQQLTREQYESRAELESELADEA